MLTRRQETVIVSTWVKAFVHHGEMPSQFYWRTPDGIEVDLLVERTVGAVSDSTRGVATLNLMVGVSREAARSSFGA